MITGFSGAGKSQAMACFEDAGYFCVDNLPPEMIGQLAELFEHEGSKVERAAVVSDVRGGDYFDGLREGARRAGRARQPAPAALPGGVRGRAGEPLQGDAPPPPARQRRLGEPGDRRGARAARAAARARRRARSTPPTSAPRGCARWWPTRCCRAGSIGKLAVTFLTYGFKHGAPRDADLLFDVRFLPNPHYEADLRPLTGLDPRGARVRGGLGRDRASSTTTSCRCSTTCCPSTSRRARPTSRSGIGCTGGRHRSVVIAEHLARDLSRTRRLHGRRGAPRHREAAAHALRP